MGSGAPAGETDADSAAGETSEDVAEAAAVGWTISEARASQANGH